MAKKKAKKAKAKRTRSSRPSELQVTRVQLADLLGVRAEHVTRLVSQGMPCLKVGAGRGNPSMFDAVSCLAWMRERSEADGNGGAQSVRDEYMAALRDRVRQDIDKRSGELLPRDEVILAGQQQVKAWTAKLRALPRQLVQAGIIGRDDEKRVMDVLRTVLTDISTWRAA